MLHIEDIIITYTYFSIIDKNTFHKNTKSRATSIRFPKFYKKQRMEYSIHPEPINIKKTRQKKQKIVFRHARPSTPVRAYTYIFHFLRACAGQKSLVWSLSFFLPARKKLRSPSIWKLFFFSMEARARCIVLDPVAREGQRWSAYKRACQCNNSLAWPEVEARAGNAM